MQSARDDFGDSILIQVRRLCDDEMRWSCGERNRSELLVAIIDPRHHRDGFGIVFECAGFVVSRIDGDVKDERQAQVSNARIMASLSSSGGLESHSALFHWSSTSSAS